MAAKSDDDVRGMARPGVDDDPEADTAAKNIPRLGDGADQEDPTVQQQMDPKVAHAARNAGLPNPPRPKPPLAPPMRITSKKMTAVGLGPVGGPPKVEPPPPPPPPAPAPVLETEADAVDDTATAPAPRVSPPPPPPAAKLPGIPRGVAIKDAADEPLDDTEARTLITKGVHPHKPPTPAAGKPPDLPNIHDDDPDDSVTTQAPSVHSRLPEDDEPRTAPPMTAPMGPLGLGLGLSPSPLSPLAPRIRAPIPAAGRRVEDDDDDDSGVGLSPAAARGNLPAVNSDAYEADESVTTRGPAVEYGDDDSVTAQAPVRASVQTPAALRQPPAFEQTGGTTNRVLPKKDGMPAGPPGVADDEPRSVTAQVPAPPLRVVRLDDDDSNDSQESSTAVMMNAPARPSGGGPAAAPVGVAALMGRPARLPMVSTAPHMGNRAAAIADLREPTSDSGLRVAQDSHVAEHQHHANPNANLDAFMAGGGVPQFPAPLAQPMPDHGSGIGKAIDPSRMNGQPMANPFAKTEQAMFTPPPPPNAPTINPRGRTPSLREIDFASTIKKPRYGLVVVLVGLLSFAIPLVLFLWLHNAGSEPQPRTPAEAASDPVPRAEGPRPRAKPSASVSATAPTQAPPIPGLPPPGPRRNPDFTPKRK